MVLGVPIFKHFRVDPFLEGLHYSGKQLEITKDVFLSKMDLYQVSLRISTQSIHR